jgi:hypothetical protein
MALVHINHNGGGLTKAESAEKAYKIRPASKLGRATSYGHATSP